MGTFILLGYSDYFSSGDVRFSFSRLRYRFSQRSDIVDLEFFLYSDLDPRLFAVTASAAFVFGSC
jgi:hypothetical protein